jgi:uncharacterized Zn finger protein
MPRFSFDLDALREHLPDKLFQRGEGYAEGGRVSVIGQHGGRVAAHIDGESGRYTVEVNEADVTDAVCSCPAFDDWGLCKHMAALAIVANALDAEAADQARSRLAHLERALELEGAEALAARLIALAKADPEVLEALES